ncbi:hypothetical protein D3C72_1857890 [compost metagenome]
MLGAGGVDGHEVGRLLAHGGRGEGVGAHEEGGAQRDGGGHDGAAGSAAEGGACLARGAKGA